jgi:hypothetical protein
MIDSGSDNIQVMVRVRPLNQREREDGSHSCVELDRDNQRQLMLDQGGAEAKNFYFDYVGGMELGQEQIFNVVGKPLTAACLEGYNCCIFAYG